MKKFMLLACLVLLVGCVEQRDIGELRYKEEASEVFEDSLEAGAISLDFDTYNGYIEIHLWDKQEYRIEVEKWARAATAVEAREKVENLQVDFSKSRTDLSLRVEEERNTGANVKAYLPRGSFDTIELTTSNGFIEIEEMTASDVNIDTSNGYIRADITADDIEIDTDNGFVEGFFQGRTVDIDTSNGFIDVECGEGGEYTLKTTNGKVDVRVGTSGEFDISTNNGSIDIAVEGDFSFDLTTNNATIVVSAEGVTYTQDTKTHKKGSTAEEPQVVITASTSNGSVTVTKT